MRAPLRKVREVMGSNPATALLVGLGMGLSIALVINYQRDHDTRTIVDREIVAHPCETAPNGSECQQLSADRDRSQSIKFACIQFRNVGYPCPIGKAATRTRERSGNTRNRGAPNEASRPPSQPRSAARS